MCLWWSLAICGTISQTLARQEWHSFTLRTSFSLCYCLTNLCNSVTLGLRLAQNLLQQGNRTHTCRLWCLGVFVFWNTGWCDKSCLTAACSTVLVYASGSSCASPNVGICPLPLACARTLTPSVWMSHSHFPAHFFPLYDSVKVFNVCEVGKERKPFSSLLSSFMAHYSGPNTQSFKAGKRDQI